MQRMPALGQWRTLRFYSITSSAVVSSDCGTVRPSALAVLTLRHRPRLRPGRSQLNSDHATVLAPINPNHTITALHLPLGPPEQRGCLLEAAAQRSFSRAQSPQL